MSGKLPIFDVLTGFELYFLKQIGRNQENTNWIGNGEHPYQWFAITNWEKIMNSVIFKSTGLALVHIVEKERKCLYLYYELSNSVITSINEQRLTSNTTNMNFLQNILKTACFRMYQSSYKMQRIQNNSLTHSKTIN